MTELSWTVQVKARHFSLISNKVKVFLDRTFSHIISNPHTSPERSALFFRLGSWGSDGLPQRTELEIFSLRWKLKVVYLETHAYCCISVLSWLRFGVCDLEFPEMGFKAWVWIRDTQRACEATDCGPRPQGFSFHRSGWGLRISQVTLRLLLQHHTFSHWPRETKSIPTLCPSVAFPQWNHNYYGSRAL